MQRQRGELVPIGEVVADLDGPVQAISRNFGRLTYCIAMGYRFSAILTYGFLWNL